MAGRKQAGDSWRGASRRLAALLHDERLARRQSQESVAREAGLALSTVRKIEANNIQEPGVFTVLALMQALDVPISQLQEVARPQAGERTDDDT
jgi:transcriptional regulator with XRE-family HTH domain